MKSFFALLLCVGCGLSMGCSSVKSTVVLVTEVHIDAHDHFAKPPMIRLEYRLEGQHK